jgi:hypothetical protein
MKQEESMARHTVFYTAYPNCPEATEYSRSRALASFYMGGLVSIGSIGSVIWFISATVSLFSDLVYLEFLKSLGLIIFVSLIDLYYFVFRNIITTRECTKIVANSCKDQFSSTQIDNYIRHLKAQSHAEMKMSSIRYLLFFFGGLFASVSGVGIIMGINFMCHRGSPPTILVFSILSFGIVAVVFLLLYKKILHKEALASQQMQNSSEQKFQEAKKSTGIVVDSNTDKMHFCRKCGAVVLPDSIYCAKCGMKLK